MLSMQAMYLIISYNPYIIKGSPMAGMVNYRTVVKEKR